MTKKSTYKHVMIDIETMGSKPYSAIVSIAAVRFDLDTGKTGEEFYVIVDLEDCVKCGLNMDPSTVLWWMKQSEEAKKELYKKGIPLKEALTKLSKFIDKEDQIWGNSPRFDQALLENAYQKCDMTIPWKFWNERDVRTLVSFSPAVKVNHPVPADAHNALADCHYQISYCTKIWQLLNKN